MKKYILILIILGFALTYTFAQDEVSDEPVYGVFDSGILIDQQTTVIPDVKTLEFIIQHKFGAIDGGLSDLWGIYSSANARLALNYVPINNVQFGIGLTKNGVGRVTDKMAPDLSAKWAILEQTQSNSIPVAVTLYGNLAIDGNEYASEDYEVVGTRDPDEYMYEKESVDLNNRLAYFSQLIISRKFNDWFSLQAGASFTHYNLADWDYDHDVVGAHVNGRIKFSPQSSIIFNYDAPLKIKSLSEQTNWDTHAKPNLSVGFEVSTFTHAFQMYIGNARGIIPQHMMMYNQNKWNTEGLAIGFTITRLWMY